MPKLKSKPKPVTNGAAGRSTNGQFQPGNKYGRGNPHSQRINEFRRAIQGAISGADLKRVIARLKHLALRGDLPAIKELLDRTIGKANTIPTNEFASIELPDMTTSGDTVKATNAILRALSNGRLTPDDGAKLAAIVELARRSIETHELTERVRALESEGENA